MQVGQDEFDSTRCSGDDSRRPRREAFGTRRFCIGGARCTRIELCVEVFLDEWSWTSCTGAEVYICVARYLCIEGLVKGAGDELCR